MGGTSSQTTNSNQTQDTSSLFNNISNTLTGSNSNQNTNQVSSLLGSNVATSNVNPWATAMPTLQSILSQVNGQLGNTGLTGTETNAIQSLQDNANNPYASQAGTVATGLLNGGGALNQTGAINNAYNQYQQQLNPYASGSMINNNQALKSQLDTLLSDASNSVNSQFAAAGRDGSAINQQALMRGYTQAAAPILANQYNQDVANQLNSANSLYGAGNTTAGLLSGLQNQYNANQLSGVNAANTAYDMGNQGAQNTLAAEALKRSIPLSALQTLAGLGTSIAGLGQSSTTSGVNQTQGTGSTNTAANTTGYNNNTSSGTASGTAHSTGTSETENQMSGVQQFATILGGLGSLFGRR